MNKKFKPTADICDNPKITSLFLDLDFINYGSKKEYEGIIVTAHLKYNNKLLFDILSESGLGKVLFIHSGGKESDAVFGDQLASLAEKNNWEGVVVYGRLRDSERLKNFKLGIKAMGTSPKKLYINDEIKFSKKNKLISLKGIEIVPGKKISSDMDGIIIY